VHGRVPVRLDLVIRFDYGSVVPWVRREGTLLVATAGPDTLELASPVVLRGEGLKTVSDFAVGEGERLAFTLNYHPSHLPSPGPLDAVASLADNERGWHEWAAISTYDGEWCGAVMRSLLTLKALTYYPTGG